MPAPVASHPTCSARPICSTRDLTDPQSRQLIPNVGPATACCVYDGARPLRDRYTSTCRDNSFSCTGEEAFMQLPWSLQAFRRRKNAGCHFSPGDMALLCKLHHCIFIFGRCHCIELRSDTLAIARATCSYSSVRYDMGKSLRHP